MLLCERMVSRMPPSAAAELPFTGLLSSTPPPDSSEGPPLHLYERKQSHQQLMASAYNYMNHSTASDVICL